MSIVNEEVTSAAAAASSCPATDVIMVVTGPPGRGVSSITPFFTPQGVVTGSGLAVSSYVIDAYTFLLGQAVGASVASHTLVATDLLRSAALGRSVAFQVINEMATAMAVAEDEIMSADVPQILVSAAQAISTMFASSVATFAVTSNGVAKSEATIGLLEILSSTAVGTAMVSVLRKVDVLASSTGTGASTATPSGEPQVYLLLSTGEAASVVQIQNDVTLALLSEAKGKSTLWFDDPTLTAWVMNTESTAVSWHDNYAFESIIQASGRVFAVGEEGLYELDGDSDAGVPIQSTLQSGFVDFSEPRTKHLDNLYFGYTSTGRIAVQTEVYDSGHPPSTYIMEERTAAAPRNNRVTPGKGLWGRYWRITLKNVEGADFEVHDASVDIAVSSRRI